MKTLLLGFAQTCLLCAGQPMTPEWVVGTEARALTALPRAAWLKDGTLLLDDVRKTGKDRVLERLDPATGKRVPALDTQRALENFKVVLAGKSVPERLPWPTELDDQGRRGLVAQGDDLFVLDLPSATFQALPGAEAATLSPDGRKVAFVRKHDLYLLDLETKEERRVTKDGADAVLNGTFSWVYWEELFDHRDTAVWWSPDSRSIAFLRSDESAVQVHSFTDIHPYQARILTQRYPQPGRPNPSVKLGVAAADTGAVAWMDVPAASYEYVAQVTWTPTGDRVAVQTLNRAQDTLELHLVDRSGKAARVLREKSDSWVHPYEPRFLKDGRHFLWASDRGGYNHLYRYTVAGQLVNPVTQGDWSLAPWGPTSGRCGLVDVDEKAGVAYFTRQLPGSVEKQLWKANLDGTGLAKVSAEPGTHAPRFSPDHRLYLDSASSASVAPSLSLRKADGSLLLDLAPAKVAEGIQPVQLLTIPAADGMALPARITRPAGFDATKRHPVIFYVYGGPSMPTVADRWLGGGMLFDQVLVAEGYVVVSVDNRCSAAIGRKFESLNKGKLFGDVELSDLVSAVKWVKAQPWADPERVGIWGWSGGGTYTLSALTHTKEFKAGISVAPVTDWRFYDTVYTEQVMGRPEDNPEGYKATSQVEAAKDLHGRLLLVYGTFDDNVHPQNSQAFADVLIAAGTPFETMVYPMRKHGITDRAATLHLYRTMVEFWKRNL